MVYFIPNYEFCGNCEVKGLLCTNKIAANTVFNLYTGYLCSQFNVKLNTLTQKGCNF